MIQFDETPKATLLQTLLPQLLSGFQNYQRTKQWRQDKSDEQQKFRINNILAEGGGDVDESDATALQQAGLGSRLSAINGAVAGQPRRYRINPTPAQHSSLVASQRTEADYQHKQDDQRKGDVIRKYLGQHLDAPLEQQAQAYMLNGLDMPDFLKLQLQQLQQDQQQAKMLDEAMKRMQYSQGAQNARQTQRLNPVPIKGK